MGKAPTVVAGLEISTRADRISQERVAFSSYVLGYIKNKDNLFCSFYIFLLDKEKRKLYIFNYLFLYFFTFFL